MTSKSDDPKIVELDELKEATRLVKGYRAQNWQTGSNNTAVTIHRTF